MFADDIICIEGYPPAGGDHRSEASPYEVRTEAQDKSYRSMFGPKKAEFNWSSDGMSFFEAVFSGRAHPGLVRAMNEGTPSDGGFAVSDEFTEQIQNVSL